jgi:fructosamine-3-kinase
MHDDNFDNLIASALHLAGDTTPLRERAAVGGGCISRAERIRTERGIYLIKLGGDGLPGFFAAEAYGLRLLAETRTIRVPAVLVYHDSEPETSGDQLTPTFELNALRKSRGFILLEWLAPPPGADHAAAAVALGHGLAVLHRASAPGYGLDLDNYIGTTPQPNGWMASWSEFFRDRRLRFQAELARRNGRWNAERERRMERLLGRLHEWIGEPEQPSLLHGDLWAGNFLVDSESAPALIDPAVYYGDREAEIAYTLLFGGFPDVFYQAYQAAWPLPDGWQERRDLYNLYHLLNHLNLFGEGYGGAVDAVLRRYER